MARAAAAVKARAVVVRVEAKEVAATAAEMVAEATAAAMGAAEKVGAWEAAVMAVTTVEETRVEGSGVEARVAARVAARAATAATAATVVVARAVARAVARVAATGAERVTVPARSRRNRASRAPRRDAASSLQNSSRARQRR